MPEFDSYPPGVPSWVDLSTSDPSAAASFYGELFGWTAEDLGPDAGHYHMVFKDGKRVAGIGPRMSEQQPPAWATWIGVEDADATLARAVEAGAQAIVPPMDVMDAGRMAVILDPTGAAVGLWQPGSHKGAELANEPGAFSWNELSTRDVKTAEIFYTTVFGWVGQAQDMGDFSYTEWKLDGRSIGGMMPMPAMVPDTVPAHWLTYFSVADTDATVATTTAHGGSVVAGPTDIPPGRFAVISDPQGAVFAVIAPPAGGSEVAEGESS